ncbi:fibronectin type III domain-containing protein [Candidatus Poriferisodalis sp.]|uniref:fibronectin type III domain-containing protein n=1 Tax=Candidatus Poriferisodalis sp. TaxID=3101277 RepID=UPI003B017C9C
MLALPAAAGAQEPVELPPGPPTGLTANEAGDAITVSWQAPTGSTPTGYIVRAIPDCGGKKKTKRVSADTTSVTFGNLKHCDTYKFWVRARNAAGKGERAKLTWHRPQAQGATYQGGQGDTEAPCEWAVFFDGVQTMGFPDWITPGTTDTPESSSTRFTTVNYIGSWSITPCVPASDKRTFNQSARDSGRLVALRWCPDLDSATQLAKDITSRDRAPAWTGRYQSRHEFQDFGRSQWIKQFPRAITPKVANRCAE